LFNLLTLTAIGLINLRWLISFHAAAVMAMDTIVTLVFGTFAGLALSPLVALVVGVRLYLRRHTVGQILAGLLLGAGSVLLLHRLGCFA
jgi:membrane-associated phospholipid phosphatase